MFQSFISRSTSIVTAGKVVLFASLVLAMSGKRASAQVNPFYQKATSGYQSWGNSVSILAKLAHPLDPNEKQLQGGVIALNDDDDDYNANSTNNRPDYLQQEQVIGEDDLQPVQFKANNPYHNTGTYRIQVLGNKTAVRLWRNPTKGTYTGTGGTRDPAIDENGDTFDMTVNQFYALSLNQTRTFYIEGIKRSDTPRDVELKFSYMENGQALVSDSVKFTVVQATLDVDRDGSLTDDLPQYWPGRTLGRAQELSIGTDNDVITPQQVNMIVAPVDTLMGLSATATLADLSNHRGICSNRGTTREEDLSFDASQDLTTAPLNSAADGRITYPIFCKDFGASGTFQLTISRGSSVLTGYQKRLPLDTDRDRLPDVFEDTYRNQIVAGAPVLTFDKNNKYTLDPTRTISDDLTDNDGTPETLGVSAAVDRNPANGRHGDGFTAFQEYRGFETRPLGNVLDSNPLAVDDAVATRQVRVLDPFVKDLFVRGEIFLSSVNGSPYNVNLGIGFMGSWANHGVAVWRLASNQYEAASRIANFNRDAGEASQLGVRIADGPTAPGSLGTAFYGVITTGSDGVRQTDVALDPVTHAPLDSEIILRFRGLPNSIIMTGGSNGIIDPPYNRSLDFLDIVANRITDGGDGKLDTVTSTYNPQGDDIVVGIIQGGLDGHLDPQTVANMAGADRLRGTITGTAADPLDPVTVANSANDELAGVVIDPNGDGLTNTVVDTDTLNADGTVSPVNPVTHAQDGFQTARGGNDFYRGTITEGADQYLFGRPAGNDVVVGTIIPAPDPVKHLENLLSRPRGDDFVTGYIAGGDPSTPTGRKLNPQLNNAPATTLISNSGGLHPAVDDHWDPDTNTVDTGADGICNTVAQPGVLDGTRLQPGSGEPNATCLGLGNDGVMDSTALGDDTSLAGSDLSNPTGVNGTPNEHDVVNVDVAHHANVRLTDDWVQYLIPAPPGGVPVVLPRLNAATQKAEFADMIKKTMAHEGSHACHLEHYFRVVGQLFTNPGGGGTFIVPFPPVGATQEYFVNQLNQTVVQLDVDGNGTLESEGLQIWGVLPTAGPHHTVLTAVSTSYLIPVPGTFDALDLDQFRLQLSHD